MSNVTSDAHLYEDRFQVTNYDQSKYDRVARISCASLDNQTTMELDINVELFPCTMGEELLIVLSTSLSPDGSRDEAAVVGGWREQSRVAGEPEASLADNFDYVCRGKIYKFVEGTDQTSMYDPISLTVFFSFIRPCDSFMLTLLCASFDVL